MALSKKGLLKEKTLQKQLFMVDQKLQEDESEQDTGQQVSRY